MGNAKQCDRCGGFYSYSNEWYDGEVAVLKTMDIKNICGFSQKQEKYWDLCPDCTNKLNKWLKNEQDLEVDHE